MAFGCGGQITRSPAQRLIDNILQARFARPTYPFDHGGFIVVQRQRGPPTSTHKTLVALMSTPGDALAVRPKEPHPDPTVWIVEESDASAFERLLQFHDRGKIALNHAPCLAQSAQRCQAYPGLWRGRSAST
jgi:hypothetical protein